MWKRHYLLFSRVYWVSSYFLEPLLHITSCNQARPPLQLSRLIWTTFDYISEYWRSAFANRDRKEKRFSQVGVYIPRVCLNFIVDVRLWSAVKKHMLSAHLLKWKILLKKYNCGTTYIYILLRKVHMMCVAYLWQVFTVYLLLNKYL